MRVLSPSTYRVGMRWLTLTYFTNGFSFVRLVTFALLMALVTYGDQGVRKMA